MCESICGCERRILIFLKLEGISGDFIVEGGTVGVRGWGWGFEEEGRRKRRWRKGFRTRWACDLATIYITS